MKIQNHKDLIVWQKSIRLVELVYKLTRGFPKEEMFGIISQIRRAAISIPSNIAEGQARAGKANFIQFLRISLGSLNELETQLIIAKKLEFGDNLQYIDIESLITEISKMLNKLISTLTTSN